MIRLVAAVVVVLVAAPIITVGMYLHNDIGTWED